MHLDPFVSVDGLPFTTTPQQLRALRGAPQEETRNAVELNELDYGVGLAKPISCCFD